MPSEIAKILITFPLATLANDIYFMPKSIPKQDWEEFEYILQSIICFTGRHYEIYIR
jgi:hypothetical protein